MHYTLLTHLYAGNNGPAVMNPTSTHEEPPPAYTKGGQQQITTADFQV